MNLLQGTKHLKFFTGPYARHKVEEQDEQWNTWKAFILCSSDLGSLKMDRDIQVLLHVGIANYTESSKVLVMTT